MIRILSENERKLISCLLKGTKIEIPNNYFENMFIEEFLDGGMWTLYFLNSKKSVDERKMLKRISEKQFHDKDGTPILVSLNIDEDNILLELDIWKVDFAPILKYPEC